MFYHLLLIWETLFLENREPLITRLRSTPTKYVAMFRKHGLEKLLRSGIAEKQSMIVPLILLTITLQRVS